MSLQDIDWRAKLRPLFRFGTKLPPGVRSLVGLVLITPGFAGIVMPLLGFWMAPLGVMFIALDIPPLAHSRLPSLNIIRDWHLNMTRFGFLNAAAMFPGWTYQRSVRAAALAHSGPIGLFFLDADGRVSAALRQPDQFHDETMVATTPVRERPTIRTSPRFAR